MSMAAPTSRRPSFSDLFSLVGTTEDPPGKAQRYSCLSRFLPRSAFRLPALYPVSLDTLGRLCHAALNGRVLSQTTDNPEVSLQRTQLSSRDTSNSLTVRKEEQCAKVEFRIKFRTDYGHQMKIVGSAVQFGVWAIAKSPSMQWKEGDVWSTTIDLPIGNIYEYKYVVVDSHGASVIHWQKGNNCVLAIGLTDTELVVGDNWEGNPGASVTSRGKGISTKEERLMDWAAEIKSQSSDSSSLVLEKKRELEKAQEENRIVRQEASRLKSELRMTSMTRQAAEQQVKELQQENRRLLALLTEQQTLHKSVLEQTLTLLNDSEAVSSDTASASTGAVAAASEVEAPVPNAPPAVSENGTSSTSTPRQGRKKPRRKSNRRPSRSNVSTRTAAVPPLD